MRSSAASFAKISPEAIWGDGVGNNAFLFDMKLLSPYAPSVAHISTRISALGNIPALIHFTLCLVRHIEESKPIEHAVDVSHAPDIAQGFWSGHLLSYLFNIAQCQQYRAPRKTFAVLPAVDPQFFCVYNPQDFPLLAVFQQIKHLKDNSSRQNPLVIVVFLG